MIQNKSVQRLATGGTVRGSNHGGSEIFQTDAANPPFSLKYVLVRAAWVSR
jgi:hypothetical protein